MREFEKNFFQRKQFDQFVQEFIGDLEEPTKEDIVRFISEIKTLERFTIDSKRFYVLFDHSKFYAAYISQNVEKEGGYSVEYMLNSTLAIYEANVPNRGFADTRTLAAMSPYLITQYQERRKRLDQEINDLTREKRLKRIMAFNYQFYKMGGLLGSGTDPGRHNLPGYGDQRDFELLVEAGFSIEEAIQVMTSNGAVIIERANIGSLTIGKRADFVILNGDLTKDPSVIKKVETVFKNGIGYDSQKIISVTYGLVGVRRN